MRPLLLFLFLLITEISSAQFTDRYWTFGDSAGIDFKNLSNPQPAHSILRVRGSCASICDSAGDLLFYCGTPNWQRYMQPIPYYNYGYVVNKNDSIMESGDSLVGTLWYQEMAIVPDPGNINRFYVFCAGETNVNKGFYYSVVDLSYNGGLGKIIQKNVQLRSDTIADAVAVVKHGNGRDWWVLIRSWKGTPVNDITAYLVSPSGVTATPTQYKGPLLANQGFGRLKFNSDGSRLYNTFQGGGIERYNFDRCTGLISNRHVFCTVGNPYIGVWDFEVSPDESKMYIGLNYQGVLGDTNYLVEFDLNNPSFLASADTIATFIDPVGIGALKRGPDNRIYLSTFWTSPGICFVYLYCDGTREQANSNLSVIQYPDSLYPANGFQKFNFNLGGKRSYLGLPNNPNYELDTLHGSPCDTLTTVGIEDAMIPKAGLNLFYSREWQSLFVNAERLQGHHGVLRIYTSSGQLIEQIDATIDSGYLMKNISFVTQTDGVYLIQLITDKESMSGKFVRW